MTWENILSDSEFQAQPDDVKMRVAKNYFKENFSADPEFKSLPSDQRMKVSFNFFKTIQKQETNGAWEGFVKPTLKAIPKVTGATVGSMALAPGAGIQGLSAMLPNANEPASFERGAKKFEEIMSFPSESLTPEERQGAENVGLAMKPFEWAGQAGAYVGRKADQGLQNLGLAPTALEPVMGAITEAALMFGLNGIPKTVKNIKSSDWYRTKTIKERAVVDSFVDNVSADIESGNMTVEQMREVMRGTDQAAKDALINKYVRGQETVTPEAPTVTPQTTTETAQIPKVTVRNGRRGQVNVKPDENILTRQPDDVPDFDPEREALKAKVAPILQEVLQSKQIEVNPEVINTQNKIAEIEGIIQKNQAYKGAPIYSTWETALAENRQKLDDMINGRQPKEQSTVQTPEPQKAEDIQLPEIVEPAPVSQKIPQETKPFLETPEGEYTLDLMSQELQAGEAGLTMEEADSGLMNVTGRFSSHSPWAKDIMKKHKVDSKYLDNIIQKHLDGKELTEKQFKIFGDIRRAANKMNYNIPEGLPTKEEVAKSKENYAFTKKKIKDEGYQEAQSVEAYNLSKGDKVIKNGEEFKVTGEEEGNLILKDGETVKVPLDETLDVNAVKKTEPRSEGGGQSALQAKPIPEPRIENTKAGKQVTIPRASEAETFSLANPETEWSKPLSKQQTVKTEDLFNQSESATIEPVKDKQGTADITSKDNPTPEAGKISKEQIESVEKSLLNQYGLPEDLWDMTEVGDGRQPQVVYHGTTSATKTLKEGRSLTKNHSVDGSEELGTFFTDSKYEAEFYAQGGHYNKSSKDSKVIEAHLDIRRPYKIRNTEQLIREFGSHNKAKEYLEDNGYDGICIEPEDGKTKWWIPFNIEDIYIIKKNKLNTSQKNAFYALRKNNGDITKAIDDLTFYEDSEAISFIKRSFIPNPSRPPEVGGQSTLYSGVDITQTLDVLRGLKGNIKEAIPHLEKLGRSVYESGKTKYFDWQKQIKSYLGDMWERFKPRIQEIWKTVVKTIKNKGILSNQRGSIGKGMTEDLKDIVKDIGEVSDEYLGSISTRLGNIHPSIKNTMRKFEYTRGIKASERRKKVLPFLEKVKKMSKEDKEAFDLARKNGNPEELKRLVSKYNIGKEYHALKEVLSEMYNESVSVGYDVGYRFNYHPRVLKDSKGFLNYFYKHEKWPIINKAIKAKEAELKRLLTADEKAKLINSLLRGYPSNNIKLSRPGQLKERLVEVITPEVNEFYMDSDSALVHYINNVTDAIEAKRLFGGGEQTVKGFKPAIPIEDTIGGYVLKLLQEEKIMPDQEQVLTDILRARFNQVGTHGFVSAYKNLSYIDTMGSPISAVTQIGDLAWALYRNGFGKSLAAAGKAIINKNKFTKEDLGVERVASEFEDSTRTVKALEKVFKLTGLTKIDNIGKETLINSSYSKAVKLAKDNPEQLRKELKPVFEKETDQLVKDLQNGNVTDNVKLYLFNTLSDFQPISLSEMPQKYLSAGNGRIFYMLKTFTLKQFDVFRREAFQKIATPGTRLQGMKNLIWLTACFVFANATADEIKDLMLNRETEINDRVIDNLFRLGGVSKFVAWQARREGLRSAVVKQIAPPAKAPDAFLKDITQAGDGKGLELTQSIPIFGKFYYWWLGKGAEKADKLDDLDGLNKLKD